MPNIVVILYFLLVREGARRGLASMQVLYIYIYNLKIYNLTKHTYIIDTIGSMIGMATLNDL